VSNRRRFVPFFIPLLFGLMAFTRVATSPRFATYYKPDVVSLIAVGMCLGAALTMLVVTLRESRAR